MPRLAVKRIEKAESAEAEAPVAQETQRHEKIAIGAYLRAEQRGFQGGDPVADWLESEVEVDHAVNT